MNHTTICLPQVKHVFRNALLAISNFRKIVDISWYASDLQKLDPLLKFHVCLTLSHHIYSALHLSCVYKLSRVVVTYKTGFRLDD
jgi:hypothetical protein